MTCVPGTVPLGGQEASGWLLSPATAVLMWNMQAGAPCFRMVQGRKDAPIRISPHHLSEEKALWVEVTGFTFPSKVRPTEVSPQFLEINKKECPQSMLGCLR